MTLPNKNNQHYVEFTQILFRSFYRHLKIEAYLLVQEFPLPTYPQSTTAYIKDGP